MDGSYSGNPKTEGRFYWWCLFIYLNAYSTMFNSLLSGIILLELKWEVTIGITWSWAKHRTESKFAPRGSFRVIWYSNSSSEHLKQEVPLLGVEAGWSDHLSADKHHRLIPKLGKCKKSHAVFYWASSLLWKGCHDNKTKTHVLPAGKDTWVN